MKTLFTREEIERREEDLLASYACKSAESRGRDHKESEALDRTCFQRDRDRILHTAAFRRLDKKTQVVVFDQGDYYRSRLTHTLETAQLSRDVARALGVNEDLTEAIALVHDIGHPPFGHTGEETLDRIKRERAGGNPQGPQACFNHNGHALKIVETLEHRYPSFVGLNLTWETREGIVKHETHSAWLDSTLRAKYGVGRPSLEAQIVDCVDTIAYTTADLDDGLHAGIISLNDPGLNQAALWRWACEAEEGGDRLAQDMIRYRRVRFMVRTLITDLIRTSANMIESAKPGSSDDVRVHPEALVGLSELHRDAVRELKNYLDETFYHGPEVGRMNFRARRIVKDLFDGFFNNPALLPLEVQNRVAGASPHDNSIQQSARKREEILAEAIIDYIAGMTDKFARETWAELFDPRVSIGGVFR